MADSRCPMCGKTNPEDLEECRHCGARLKPLLASTPPEESRPPSRPEPPEASEPREPEPIEEDSGDWLDDLRDEVVKGTDELGLTGALDPTRLDPPPKRPPPKPGEEGTPEWLQRLRKKRESQPEAVEPDIKPLPPSDEPPLSAPEPPSETPTWMEHFREAEETEDDILEQTPPAPRPRSAGGLRERLAAVEREEEPPDALPPVDTPASDFDEVPSEAFETLPGLSARAASEEPEAGLPDWLSDPAPEPETPPEIPEALETKDIPGMSFQEQDPAPAEDGLPDWLQDLKPDMAPSPESAPDEAPVEIPPEALETKDIPGMSFQEQDPAPAEDGLPDWLQGLKPEMAPPPDIPPDEAPVEIPPEALETKDIPGLGFQEEGAAEQADLPDWLKDLAPEDELPVGPPSEDLPAEPAEEPDLDWLPEITDKRAEPPADAVDTKDIPDLSFQAPEVPPEEETSFTGGIPPAEDVPEWLQGLAPEAPDKTPDPITPGLPPEPSAELEQAETAAWPPEPTQEDIPPEALETRDIPGLSFKAEAEPPDLEPAGDLPDWLQDVQAATTDPGLSAESPGDTRNSEDLPEISFGEGTEDEEAPEWLLGLEAEAAEAAAAVDAVELPPAPESPVAPGQPATDEHEDILPELDVGPPEGEVPEWLAAAAAAVPSSGPLVLPEEEEAEPPTLDVPAQPAEALPDWLQDAGPPPEGEELPDLDALPEPLAVEPEIEEEPAPLEDEIPPWMSDEGLEAVLPPVVGDLSEPEEVASESPILEEEAPEWLQPAEVERESAVALEQEDLPDWLQGLQAAQEQAIPEHELRSEPESPVDLEAAEPSEAVPPWLAELRAKTTEAPMIGEFEDEPEEIADIPLQVGVEPQLDGVESADLPDWISEISPERAGQVEIEGDESLETPKVEAGDDLEPAELPGWLKAMRPVEAVTPLSPSEEATRGVEGVGPLAGLQGILPAEPEISVAGRPPSFSMRVEVTQNQIEHVEKLKTLLEEEAESQAVGPRWGVVQPQHVLRWIILAILLLAVGIPLAFGFQQNDLPTLVPEETLEVGNLVLGLPLNARVLVSFDYQPGLSGEMDAAAEAVIDHMIRLRQVDMVMVSTNTSGPALAERFLSDPLGVGQHAFVHGENYVNLGYIPGGAAGLIDFAVSPRRVLPIPFNLQGVPETSGVWGVPLLADVGTVADFDLVVVVVDDASTARAWVEQVEPRLEEVPLLMVSSAQAAPLILPYFRTDPRQVDGLVSGLPGAVSYLRINDGANLARPYWDAFGNGLLIASLLIVVGGFISVSANILRRTQPGSIEEMQ